MFEILKALMALRDAADAHDRGHWYEVTRDGTYVLRVEVNLTEEDVEFIDQMRQLVGS